MKLPGSLHVNGRTIRLIPKPAARLPDVYGQWHEAGGKIDYRTRLASIALRDTLLHELMHAIRSTQGREYGGEVEEDYVRSLATGLIGVFDDNPEFAQWLITKRP